MNRWLGLTILLATVVSAGCATLVTSREDFRLAQAWTDYDKVVVRTLNGRVELTSSPTGSEFVVTGSKQAGGATIGEARANLAEVHVAARPDEHDPKTLVVELDYPEELRHKNVGATINMTVPQPVASDVSTGNGSIRADTLKSSKLHTSNGRITAAHIDGRLDAHTSNGDIVAERIGGDAELETSNGDVTARTVQGNTRVDTSNGHVDVYDAHGNVEVETSNGSIVAEAKPGAEGRVTLVSSNGNIRATIPPEMKGAIDLSTSNGSLTTHLGAATLSHAEWGRRRLTAQLNGGGAGQILARSSNGSVTVECR